MTVTTTQTKIRSILKRNQDGLTVKEMSNEIGIPTSNIYGVVRAMPDTYIDRWLEPVGKNPYTAVWCSVVPPEDCPHPKGE